MDRLSKLLAVVVLLMIPQNTAPDAILSGPVMRTMSPGVNAVWTDVTAYWTMNEASGTREDSIGSADLTPTASDPASVSGKLGNAADLERDNTQYFSTADAAGLSFSGTDSFSISAWIKLETTGTRMRVISKWGASAAVQDWELTINATLGPFFAVSDSATTASINDGTALNTDWHHIVAVFDNANNELRLYLDGSQCATPVAETNDPTDSSSTIYVGNDYDGSDAFDGLIDDLCLFRKALTDANVTTLYNGGNGRAYPN